MQKNNNKIFTRKSINFTAHTLSVLFILAFFIIPQLSFAIYIGAEFPTIGTVGPGGSTVPAAPDTFTAAACIVVKLVLDFIPYMVVMAVGAFLQGLVKYVKNGDNEEKMTEGRKMMIYGIFGFFMMVSIWGIMNLFTNSFGLGNALVPQFKSSTGSISGSCK